MAVPNELVASVDQRIPKATRVLPELVLVPPASNETITQRLQVHNSFERLPDNALLNQDQLLVRQHISSDEQSIHRYYAEDIVGELVCANCGTQAMAGEQFCERCGNSLADAEHWYPPRLLDEVDSAEKLTITKQLLASPPNLVGVQLPLVTFSERFADQERNYVVRQVNGERLDRLTQLVEVPLAVQWGIVLAKGLAHLHQRSIVFQPLTDAAIYYQDQHAYFADYLNTLLSNDFGSQARNVHKLVGLLNRVATGSEGYQGDAQLPEPFDQLLARVLAQHENVTAQRLVNELERIAEQIRRPESVGLWFGRKTDVGMLRQLNEDSFLTLDLSWNNQSLNKPIGVFVVADGMGGHDGGEIASGMTISSIGRSAVESLLIPSVGEDELPEYETWVINAIQLANHGVYQRAQVTGNDLGTTVVVLVVIGDNAWIGHAGDSRAYLLRGNDIKQITTDHSLVERMIATGQITRTEARTHPQGNIVYRTIGDKAEIVVDTEAMQLQVDDAILLCSDGLSGMIHDDTILRIVNSAPSPQSACEELIKAANLAGGDDNITAVLVQLTTT